MKRILKIVLPLLILLSGIGVFAALKVTKPEQPTARIKERVWRVDVERVQPAALAPSLTLYGQLETPSLFKAAAPAPSRVDRVLVREGESVSEGQLLVSLDERDYLPGLDQARAEVADLEAQIHSEGFRHASDRSALKQEKKLLELAGEGVDRAQRMLRQKLGADFALDEAEQILARQQLTLTARQLSIRDHPARLKALEARLQRMRARLRETELDYERSQVQAPYAGIVAEVEVAEGDQVKDNAILLSLYDPGKLELRARIPAPYQDELQQALAAGQPLQGEALLGETRIRLTLARLAGRANANGVDALFRVDQGLSWLRVGQVVRFDLSRMPRENAVAVPYQAVYGSDRVYKLADGRMQGLRVQSLGAFVTADGEERLLVQASGLEAGDDLVITPLPNAVDGLRVEAVVAQ